MIRQHKTFDPKDRYALGSYAVGVCDWCGTECEESRVHGPASFGQGGIQHARAEMQYAKGWELGMVENESVVRAWCPACAVASVQQAETALVGHA